jgi:Na+-transporting NADH:ubiquinone oxidoreductase subunit C
VSKFNKESNRYIWIFSIVMTLVLGSLLSFVSGLLKPIQDAEVALEQKKFILSAAMGNNNIKGKIKANGKEWVNVTYDSLVKSFVINVKGEIQDSITVEQISIAKEYKKDKEDRLLPVYTITSGDKIESYVFPVAGFGLWDRIWGFVALESDLSTVQGVVFDHVGETPGLGARITSDKIQSRYIGKSIYDKSGELIGVNMQKGEGVEYTDKPHKVDGMSGATLTAVGLNTMYVEYFELYNNFIQQELKNR